MMFNYSQFYFQTTMGNRVSKILLNQYSRNRIQSSGSIISILFSFVSNPVDNRLGLAKRHEDWWSYLCLLFLCLLLNKDSTILKSGICWEKASSNISFFALLTLTTVLRIDKAVSIIFPTFLIFFSSLYVHTYVALKLGKLLLSPQARSTVFQPCVDWLPIFFWTLISSIPNIGICNNQIFMFSYN